MSNHFTFFNMRGGQNSILTRNTDRTGANRRNNSRRRKNPAHYSQSVSPRYNRDAYHNSKRQSIYDTLAVLSRMDTDQIRKEEINSKSIHLLDIQNQNRNNFQRLHSSMISIATHHENLDENQLTFKEAQTYYKKHCSGKKGMTKTLKLELYALNKQATIGDINIPKPASILDFDGKARWEAWDRKRGFSKEQAQNKFVSKIELIKRKRNA